MVTRSRSRVHGGLYPGFAILAIIAFGLSLLPIGRVQAQAVNRSLSFNGSSAYAEVPHASELNSAGDWTIEAWMWDANPTYNHPRRRIVTKGDISAAEVPFFASVGGNLLTVGVRANGGASTVTYDLAAGSVTPNAWHHFAATFQASSRLATIYVDGVQRAQRQLDRASAGNTLPLIIGRSGASGEYWQGILDDVRVWSVVRTGADISASAASELSVAPTGLVGNWRFNEGTGSSAADNAGTPQNAMLVDTVWSDQVPPGALPGPVTPGTATPTVTSTATPPPAPSGSFSLAASPSSQTIGLTGSVGYEATVAFGSGFTELERDPLGEPACRRASLQSSNPTRCRIRAKRR